MPAVSSAPLLFAFLESIVCKLAAGEIFIFKLVSVAEENGLKLALSETLNTEAHIYLGKFKTMDPILSLYLLVATFVIC